MSRPSILHELKCAPPYCFVDVPNAKTFELRVNDRDYKVGDFFRLHEWHEGHLTEAKGPILRINYVLYGPLFGLKEGWCIFC